MKTKMLLKMAAGSVALAAMLGAAWPMQGQAAKGPYPQMAPVEKYMMADRNEEIALARSAAPESISKDAKVLVMGRHGYETAEKGTNGFVCMVLRSWTAGIDDPVFWNPKLRAPICFNPPAVRTYLPIMVRKTELILGGKSKEEMFAAIEEDFKKKELGMQARGAMSYMMSKEQYLNDSAGHWHPHVMFFEPPTDPKSWGANLDGSPILESDDAQDHLNVFMVLVPQWSDGTMDEAAGH